MTGVGGVVAPERVRVAGGVQQAFEGALATDEMVQFSRG